MYTECTDTELIANFRKGCQSSYRELVERYTQKAFNLSLRITRNQEDAEEVLQDVFSTIYQKIDKFEGKSAFSSWLYRITCNTAFMKLRKRKQKQTISLEDVKPNVLDSWSGAKSENTDVNYMSTRHQLRTVLQEAVNKLPDDYRQIFLLRDVDGLSNQEVAEVLSLSVPAVKSRLHRARLLLRKRLSRFYDDYMREDFIYYGPGAGDKLKSEHRYAA